MSSLLTTLGLRATSPASPAPPLAPYYLAFNVLFAYAVLTSRPLKQMSGIDNNVSPREDVAKYGEAAVREGKITRAQLNKIKRTESAHANAIENFPILVGSLLFASYAGLPNEQINTAALLYSCARVAYAISYIYTEKLSLSYLRSILWWIGTCDCLYLLWRAGQSMNSKA